VQKLLVKAWQTVGLKKKKNSGRLFMKKSDYPSTWFFIPGSMEGPAGRQISSPGPSSRNELSAIQR
jgi:hypothetical protein